MKKFILILIFIFGSNKVFCQIDTLLVDSTKIWSTLQLSLFNNASGSTVYYQFKGDSILNETVYKKVWISFDESHINWTKTNQLIRQEGQKVYLFDYNSERVLYDFSLKELDTFDQYVRFGGSSLWTVVQKDKVIINGSELKKIKLKFGDSEIFDIWIEGIGSSYGVNTPGNIIMDFSTDLLCVQKENQTIYSNPKYDNCYITLAVNENYLQKEFNCITYSNCIKIETSIMNYDYKLLNVSGAILDKGHLQGCASIPIASLSNGIYLIYFYSENERFVYKLIKK